MQFITLQGRISRSSRNLGQASWHAVGVPYSMAALWKAMPSRKMQGNETPNVMEYVAPGLRIQDFVGLAALFSRSVPSNETLDQAYEAGPFNAEPQLASAITEFERDLAKTDAYMVAHEKG
ncbi:hypothetical protein Poli38472_001615 [Pythium oligandrum]|uniref:Uncharacterized protein n=1 Tax=Pythium oligandrum TaxID=41045 RepID=A0A8K1CTW2_PYTOL|nr:hypothetical protein Poli38472_001615 [Pythium oligandrum]|eukprot:TMW69459.1 hypothetical protein Poli38472_001615 [Pythium oligandrum]